ncbi:ABC transporter permease [Prauserella muralis]|uniref:ABC transporter permease n=1 Tax=Prauserella muralis TaxID=588067 RepID=UPI000DD48104|nr:ABC transporter permease [Prauserella muralis]TWE28784.1 NitT/TauT family transport system permease protein [Prauserella muralis]
MTGQVLRSTDTPVADIDVSDVADRLRRDRGRQQRKRKAWAILTPLAVLLAWELATRTGLLDERFFPSPTGILTDSSHYFTDPQLRAELFSNLAQSGVRLGIGFLLGSAVGLVVGLAMGLHPVTRYALSSLISGIYPLPKLTLFPLMIIFFGIGNTSMIALIALGVFFMVSINTTSGVIYSNPVYGDVASAFELPRLVRLRTITIPAAIPSVIGGLRLGFGQALIIVVSTEFVAGDGGVGYMIWNSWQVLNVPVMFLGLAIVGLTGWLVSACISLVGRLLAPWQND